MLVCTIVAFAILFPQSIVSSAAAPVAVQVSIYSNQSVVVVVPPASNISLLSVTGNQYNVGVTNGIRSNILTFSPTASNGTYSVLLNVSSDQSTYATIMQSTGVIQTLVKNVTSSGNLLVNLSVTVTEQVSSGVAWNALSGFLGLGLNLGGVNLDTTDVLAIFLGISLTIIGLGANFNQKFLFVGLFLLSILGIVAVGIIGVGLTLGAYILSFVAIKSYYRFLDKRDVTRL
jgi:hypothetical protein